MFKRRVKRSRLTRVHSALANFTAWSRSVKRSRLIRVHSGAGCSGYAASIYNMTPEAEERIKSLDPAQFFTVEKVAGEERPLVSARIDIDKGTVVAPYNGEVISVEEAKRREKLDPHSSDLLYEYKFRGKRLVIDGGATDGDDYTRFLRQSEARFPRNLVAKLWVIEGKPRIFFRTTRYIRKEEVLRCAFKRQLKTTTRPRPGNSIKNRAKSSTITPKIERPSLQEANIRKSSPEVEVLQEKSSPEVEVLQEVLQEKTSPEVEVEVLQEKQQLSKQTAEDESMVSSEAEDESIVFSEARMENLADTLEKLEEKEVIIAELQESADIMMADLGNFKDRLNDVNIKNNKLEMEKQKLEEQLAQLKSILKSIGPVEQLMDNEKLASERNEARSELEVLQEQYDFSRLIFEEMVEDSHAENKLLRGKITGLKTHNSRLRIQLVEKGEDPCEEED